MIERIQGSGGSGLSAAAPAAKAGGTDLGRQFGEMLNKAMARIEADEKQVAELQNRFLTGDLQHVEQMLIAGEKAALNLELTIQIRNKVIEAYQEIMRIQI